MPVTILTVYELYRTNRVKLVLLFNNPKGIKYLKACLSDIRYV
jgi:hypothetical protein